MSTLSARDFHDRHGGNLYALFESRFPSDGDARWAIETADGRRYGFSDLREGSARVAAWLGGLGIERGARVLCQVDKSVEAVLLYLGVLRAGLCYVPLNPAYREAEVRHFLADAEPAVVVCRPADEGWVAPLCGAARLFTLGEHGDGSLPPVIAAQAAHAETARLEADAVAVLLYTSGTTGRSKGAMLSHYNLAANADALHQSWGYQPGDVLLHALPIFHAHGLFVGLHGALYNGSGMLWLPRFELDAVLRLLPRATLFMGVPTYYVRLLEDARLDAAACAGVRLFVSGSAPLLAETHRAFGERTGHVILERYGMSETVMLTSNPYHGERRPGTVGTPLPGVEVRLRDDAGAEVPPGGVGEVQVRGPSVFRGYYRRAPGDDFVDGWFRTGDLGRFDEAGYLCLVGRSKDLIITGGYNVYPKEIELLLDDLPGVAESAVVGVPHKDFGEAVTAVVVARAGAVLGEAELLAALRGRVAGYKLPKRVHVVDALPRNAMGKVQKNLLRQRFGGAA